MDVINTTAGSRFQADLGLRLSADACWRIALGLLLLGTLVLSGCASTSAMRGTQSPAPDKANPLTHLPILSLVDPFEEYNRKVFEFNTQIDEAFLKPVATAYREAIPIPVRNGVTNFFANYRDFWSALNAFAQLEPAAGFDNFLRFGLNTAFGFYGLLDVAGDLGIERHKKDLGQTLARWGVRSGPYVVLPLYGPTTLRDAGVFPVEQQAELIREMTHRDSRLFMYSLQTIDRRANLLRVSAALEAAALDRYTFTRDAFLQLRNNEIWDGNPPDNGADRPDKDDEKPKKP